MRFVDTIDDVNKEVVYFIGKPEGKPFLFGEVKKQLHDKILESNNTQGYYSIQSEKAECKSFDTFVNNTNIIKEIGKNEIIILNNEEKTKEINDFIEKTIPENNNLANIYVESVTENQITISINYYLNKDYDNKIVVKETFDL